MKRFLLVFVLSLIINPVMAKNVKVEALSSFTTANPSPTWTIKVKDNFIMEDGTKVRANTIIEGKVDLVISELIAEDQRRKLSGEKEE